MDRKTFLVILKDKRKGELTQDLLVRHVEYLKTIRKSGHLPFCGPLLSNDSGMWILRCKSADEAQDLIQQDPFVSGRYYQTFEFHEMLEAGDSNNWLMDVGQTQGNLTPLNRFGCTSRTRFAASSRSSEL